MSEDVLLETRLAELLDVERFPVPPSFAEHALVRDADALRAAAEADPEGFWADRAGELDWFSPWDRVLNDDDPPFYKWFEGGTLNASYNCLARHVLSGDGDRVAFHWRGEEGEERDLTYADLLAQVQRAANALTDAGIGAGDVVGIFLPMIPEVVVAMLACARIGAPHNVVFGGFSAESVAERMEFSDAKALITVDGARRKGKTAAVKASVDVALDGLPALETIFVVRHTGIDTPMTQGRDRWWDEALEAADPTCEAVPLDAEHPLFILYSSGSTASRRASCTPPAAISPAWRGRTGSCSTSSRSRTSTSARPTSAGSPGTPTSSTGRWPTAARR